MQHRSPQTICGIVHNIGRDGEKSSILRLDELAEFDADMFTTVIIGNSETHIINGKLVTPRGYTQIKTDMQSSEETVPESDIQNSPKSTHPRFPVFIPLEGKAVMIVGGGKVAARRAKTLLDFGASVTIISPEICADLQKIVDRITWIKQHYNGIPFDLTLIIAATNDRQVNKQIGEDAKSLGIPVSIADRKEKSTFWFPAIARSGGIVAGLVSEEGNHTAVKSAANKIRDLLDSQGEEE